MDSLGDLSQGCILQKATAIVSACFQPAPVVTVTVPEPPVAATLVADTADA
jgi:hypothetical protein